MRSAAAFTSAGVKSSSPSPVCAAGTPGLAAVVDACQTWVASHNRRLSFEWALIDGVNDRPSDATELAGRDIDPPPVGFDSWEDWAARYWPTSRQGHGPAWCADGCS